MYLYGRNSVFERIKVAPETIEEVFLAKDFDYQEIISDIKKKNLALRFVTQKELNRFAFSGRTQGIVAKVREFKYIDFEELIANVVTGQNSFIFLDRIYDPNNLGAIIRTLACFGGFSLVIPKHNACSVTEATLHIACGGENYVSVAMVTNMSQTVRLAKKQGIWVVGAVVEAGQVLGEVKFPFPLGLVIGSEGSGIRYGLDKHLDLKVKIPMQGATLSLNASVACAVFCYEINKQK